MRPGSELTQSRVRARERESVELSRLGRGSLKLRLDSRERASERGSKRANEGGREGGREGEEEQ